MSKEKSEITFGNIRPLKPVEVIGKKEKQIPDTVLDTFNMLIAQNFRGGSATILQPDVVAALKKRGLNIEEVFEKGWLDVEGVYEKAGWNVEYDKPGYNETYDASFKFSSSKIQG
jgi:hypothetical protein